MRASSKTLSLLAASVLAIGVLAGTFGGCGSSGGGNTGGGTGTGGVKATGGSTAAGGTTGAGNATGSGGAAATVLDLCNQYCAKCYASMETLCQSTCNSEFGGASCTNDAAIAAAAQTCINMSSCTDVTNCFMNNIPMCQGGTAGASGSQTGGAGGHAAGGANGGGGTSGASASCSTCDKAATCCTAGASLLGMSSSACSSYSAAMCNASADPATTAATCQQLLSTGAQFGVAACK